VKPPWSPLARVSLAGLVLFGISMAGAMWAYAGGSWRHPRAPSHAFFENYWCDLLREPAHNGRPNALSVQLATLGFAALALALGPFWLEFSRIFSDGRRGFLRFAGVLSAAGTAAVALVPSDRCPAVHAPAVLTAGGLGFACGCVCASWALRHFAEVRAFGLASLVLVGAAAANLALYVRVAYCGGTDTVVLPAVQKLATLALVVWLVAGLYVSASRPKP
jgi:hypothetical protein